MVRPSLIATVVVLLVAALGTMAFAASQRARGQRSAQSTGTQPASGQAAAAPQPGAQSRALQPLSGVARTSSAPKKPAPRPDGTSVLRVRPGRSVSLRAKPGGHVVTRVGATTQFGSATTLTVAEQHGRWLGVTSTDLPNGKLGWVRSTTRGRTLEGHRTRIAIRIDLSKRRLRLTRAGRTIRTASVGIGRPGSATPTGRFAITDKLDGRNYGSYYGCCILALSGHQTNTPAGWKGGDRLAIHGTDNPASIGVPSSAGCLHADAEDLRVLMRRVPLGTPVFISA